MIVPGYYKAGTASLTQGEVAVTGQDTAWLAAAIQPGDMMVAADGRMAVVDSIESNTALTLLRPWPGATQAEGQYEIWRAPDSVRMSVQTRELLELLSNGTLTALADQVNPDLTPLLLQSGTAFAAMVEVPSAAMCNIGAADSYLVRITGAETINAFTGMADRMRLAVFAGALTLSIDALPEITTAPGDSVLVFGRADGSVGAIYQRVNGQPLGGAPETVNIASLSGGVLEIPAGGNHFTVAWPGNANFEITGFGNLRSPGSAFSVYFPRTVGLTGGLAGVLGNRIRLIHAASGPGLDLTMARRMVGGSPIYTYDARPNANDSVGNAAALYERLTFVPLGDGRHRLVRLPDPAWGENNLGTWRRWPDGKQVSDRRITANFAINTAFGSSFVSPGIDGSNWPAIFTEAPSHPVGVSQDGTVTVVGAAAVACGTYYVVRATTLGSAEREIRSIAEGPWK